MFNCSWKCSYKYGTAGPPCAGTAGNPVSTDAFAGSYDPGNAVGNFYAGNLTPSNLLVMLFVLFLLVLFLLVLRILVLLLLEMLG